MKMNKLLALTLGLALGLMICAFACAQEGESVGLSAIPEIPAELIAEIPAAYVEEPSAEPAQTPSIPVVLPAVENSQEFVPTLSSNYAYISGGTRLYKTAAKDKLLGTFAGTNPVRVIWQKDYYNETGDVEYSLYQAVFYANGQRVEGYFYASALGFLTLRDEAELLDGSDELKILTADFEFAADETPAPDYPCTNTNAVNLRKGPAKSEEKLAQLADGTHLDVIEAVTNAAGEVWLKVTAGGKTGYVMASLVDGYSLPKEEKPAEEPTPAEEQPETDPTEEPTPAEEPAPAEEQPVERKILVSFTCDTEALRLGSRVTLTATLVGYEGLNYTCCWQYAAADAQGNIIGPWKKAGEGLSYTYTLQEDNLLTGWRMCVTIHE